MGRGWFLILLCMEMMVRAQGVDPQTIEQLANTRVPVNGYFAQYDRDNPFGWIYLTSDGSTLVKLEGMDPETGYLR